MLIVKESASQEWIFKIERSRKITHFPVVCDVNPGQRLFLHQEDQPGALGRLVRRVQVQGKAMSHGVLANVLMFLTFIVAMATAANSAVIGLAGTAIAASTNMKSALLLGAVGVCLGLALLNPAVEVTMLNHVMPLDAGGPMLAQRMFAALFGTGAAVICATWAGVPAPIFPALAFSLFAVATFAGAEAGFGAAVLVAAQGPLSWIVSGLIAFLCVRGLARAIIRAERPRDRYPLMVAVVCAGGGALSVILLALAVGWGRHAIPHAAIVALTALLVGAAVGGAAYWWARRSLFSISNDPVGVETAFRRAQLAVGTVGLVALSAFDTLTVGLVGAAGVAAARGGARLGDWSTIRPMTDPMMALTLFVAAAVGVLLFGNRVLNWVGDRLLPSGPLGAIGVDAGTAIAGAVSLALGLPPGGGLTPIGAALGMAAASGRVTKALPELTRFVAGWFIAVLVAVVASLSAFGVVSLIHL